MRVAGATLAVLAAAALWVLAVAPLGGAIACAAAWRGRCAP